jgi:hypothetical protein
MISQSTNLTKVKKIKKKEKNPLWSLPSIPGSDKKECSAVQCSD